MYNLLLKELRLGVNPFFYVLPFLTGALMLIPAWLYFLVVLYFCFLTIPNIFAGYKSQNDLIFTSILPVTKEDIVKAKMLVIVILELLHMIIAVIYGLISVRLYPHLQYFFFLNRRLASGGLISSCLRSSTLSFLPCTSRRHTNTGLRRSCP